MRPCTNHQLWSSHVRHCGVLGLPLSTNRNLTNFVRKQSCRTFDVKRRRAHHLHLRGRTYGPNLSWIAGRRPLQTKARRQTFGLENGTIISRPARSHSWLPFTPRGLSCHQKYCLPVTRSIPQLRYGRTNHPVASPHERGQREEAAELIGIVT